MIEVAILTDSVACLPPDLAQTHHIGIIPVRVSAAGREYHDNEAALPPSTVRQLQQAPALDTTPWSPEMYRRAYRDAGAAARSVLHVVAFSQFTSTISQARAGAAMAEADLPGLRVVVFDSAATAMSQGFIALGAARAAARGASLSDVIARAEEIRQRVSAVFVLESLHYLARTGRVHRLASWASSLLRVRPVVALEQGHEHPIALPRSRAQAKRLLLDYIDRTIVAGMPLHVAVMVSDDREEAEWLLARLQDLYQPEETLFTAFSPVTRSVAGPGVLGVAFYCGA